MGMFDYYVPDPVLQCPVCGSDLREWQGKEGAKAQLIWRQGVAAPVSQRVDDEIAISRPEREKFRLPRQFSIYSYCCGNNLPVEAECQTTDGVWTTSCVVTAQSATQRSSETAAEFNARVRWLNGKARA